jgi:hypothetical protein
MLLALRAVNGLGQWICQRRTFGRAFGAGHERQQALRLAETDGPKQGRRMPEVR